MKHKGNKNEFKQQQDEEVMSAYRRVFDIYGGRVGVRQLYELVAFAPSSRFFVSDLQALRVVKDIIGGKKSRMRSGRSRMYGEIHQRVLCLRQQQPRLSLSAAVSSVLQQPAPEMYISPRQIADIVDKQRKLCYKRKIQRYSRLR